MKKSIVLISIVAILVVGIFLSGCTTDKSTDPVGNSLTDNKGAETGLAKAPEFTATTIDGKTVSMSSYLSNGKPTLVYFMASWCPTCAKNWPSLNKIYTEYGDKANIIAISIDPTDTQEVLSKLSAERGLIFPIVPGNPQIMIDFGVKGQATTVGVDADGNIRFIKSGEFSADEYRSMINSLL